MELAVILRQHSRRQPWWEMQVPLYTSLRDFIASGFVQYEYSTIGFVSPETGGALP